MGRKAETFEDSLVELEKIVELLEKGELSLDDSLEVFQKGMNLVKKCNKKLDEAEKKISIFIENEKGELTEEIFDNSED